jgi:hypothetical protein
MNRFKLCGDFHFFEFLTSSIPHSEIRNPQSKIRMLLQPDESAQGLAVDGTEISHFIPRGLSVKP